MKVIHYEASRANDVLEAKTPAFVICRFPKLFNNMWTQFPLEAHVFISSLIPSVSLFLSKYLFVQVHSPIILNNYSSKWRWITVSVYTKPVNSQRQKINFICSKFDWKGGDSSARSLCFANQWMPVNIPSLSSQWERAKMDTHWFCIY